MQLNLSEPAAANLRRRAAREGFDSAEAYAEHLLGETPETDVSPPEVPRGPDPDIDWETPVDQVSSEVWLARFRDLMSRMRPRNPNVDDSRDSIYD